MHTPEQLTDEQIVALRDQHLPSQGEPFDCIAFARAILLAHADASTPVGYMHPEDFRDVARGGWVHTVISGKRDSPYMVPLYASPQAAGPAAPRQQPEAGRFSLGDHVLKRSGAAWSGKVVGTYSTALTPEGYAVESLAHPGSVQIYPAAALRLFERSPAASGSGKDARSDEPEEGGFDRNASHTEGRYVAETAPPAAPGELPPLIERPGGTAWTHAEAIAIKDYARLALATSPLPAERVERVMDAVLEKFAWTSGTDVDDALAAVRAILEGRQP